MTTKEKIYDLCKKNGISISRLEKTLGFGNGSLAKSKVYKADRVKTIADYFHVSPDYLMIDEKRDISEERSAIGEYLESDPRISEMDRNISVKNGGFYVDADTLSLMQFMADRPQYKVLFKAARDVREEDIAKVKAVLDAFRKDEYAE